MGNIINIYYILMSTTRYVFVTEYNDPQSLQVYPIQITYYPYDRSIEMYDLKLRRIFLKRTIMGHVWLDNLCIDSIITINNRRLKIIEYGDVATNKFFNDN